jgi:hypothetical protein
MTPVVIGPKQTGKECRQNEVCLIEGQRPMAYWGWDLKSGKYSWCNEMYRIFNLPPQQPLRTGTFFNGVHPEDRQKVAKALGKAMVGGAALYYSASHCLARWLCALCSWKS